MKTKFTFLGPITLFILFLIPYFLFANGEPTQETQVLSTLPTEEDSLADRMGHCKAILRTDYDCNTKTVTLSAFILWSWTGQVEPLYPNWSTGETGHKIIVTPPGTWSYDGSISGCEITHWATERTITGSFFDGEITIEGPPIFCPGQTYEMTVTSPDDYQFSSYSWQPQSLDGSIMPYTLVDEGNYSVTATDQFGCHFTDKITIVPKAPPSPTISGPSYICEEGGLDTAFVNQNFNSYLWSTGETTNLIEIMSPGIYELTVTDQDGCTGTQSLGVQTGDPGLFSISLSAPAICAGQRDTLRVLGGFDEYVWSNNVSGITNIVTLPGTYTVTVTSFQGCTGTASVTVGALPTPSISLAGTVICPEDTVTLVLAGGPYPQYLWSNGQTSNSIAVSVAGTYTVTVSGNGICSATANATVKKGAAPDILIAPVEPLNCILQQTTLNAQASSSGPEFAYTWTTLDGNFVSGQNTLIPVVDEAGTYILQMTNVTTGCSSSEEVALSSNTQTPPVNVGNPVTLTCALTQLNIGPANPPLDSSLAPNWSANGAGNIVSGQASWNPVVNQPGFYTLTVTDPANFCTSAATVFVEQDIATPVAAIATPSQINCMVNNAVLNGSGSSSGPEFSYGWTTVDGFILGNPKTQVTTAGSAGNYTLLVTNTSNGCTESATVTVTASQDLPVVNATAAAMLSCDVLNVLIDATGSSAGPTFSYMWTGPGIITGQNTLEPIVDAPGTYSLQLTNNANSCTATLSVTVTQDTAAPFANAGPLVTLNCISPALQLNGTASAGGANFNIIWTTLDGQIVSGSNNLTPTISMAGTYQMLVTNLSNGCTASSTVVVQNDANAPLAAIAQPAILTCNTLQTILNGESSTQGPNFNFVWSGPGILSGQNTLQPTVNSPGIYTLDIINSANGCTDTETVLVAQDITAPTAFAGNDAEINCFNPNANIGSTSNPSGADFTFEWTTLGGNFTSPTNGPIAGINAPGAYQLLITNITNGCTDSDDVIVVDDFVQPLVDAGPGFELTCIQTTTTLQGSGSTGPNFSYLWTTTDGFILNGANTLNPTVNADGTYNLLISNAQNGCSSTDQVLVSQSADVPNATVAPAATLTCALNSINLNATGSSVSPSISYIWTATNGGNIITGGTSLTPTIDEPGIYTLQVLDATNNCTSVATVLVSENIIQPEVEAGNDNTLTCSILNLPLAASLLSSASPNVDYTWTTSNGIILSGGNTPTPTIAAAGTYFVQATDLLNGCSGTDNVEIFADVNPPIVGIAVPAILNCNLTQTTLDASASSVGANFSYLWSTTNGNIVSGANTLSPEINQEGVYNLLISNTQNGCTQSANVSASKDITPPIANAGPSVHLDCDTQVNTLQGNASSQGPNFTYLWTTVDGQILSGANTLNPQIGQAGDYLLRIENIENGCSASTSVLVIEDIEAPIFSIADPAVLNCLNQVAPLIGTGTGFGNAPLYSWSTSDGNILSGSNQLIAQVDAPGTYILTIQNTQNGCNDSEQVLVMGDLASPSLNTLPVLPLTCSITERVLTASTISQAQVLWSTLDGNFVSGYNTLNPVVNAPGLYSVQVTSAINGCTAQAYVSVLREQNVPDGLQFSLDPPLCNGVLGLLSVDQIDGGIGPFEYSMDGGQSFSQAPEFEDLEPGDYTLMVRDQNGCKLTQNLTVPAPFTPSVDLLPAFEIRLGDEQMLQAILPSSYPISLIDQVIWTPTTGLSFTGNTVAQLLSPLAQPFKTTEYELTILTKEGCKASARTTIRVDQKIDIYAPNIIWPEDPDGQNAAFTLFTREGSVNQILSLQIYDRWGEQLFVNRNFLPDDPSLGWPGDAKGIPVNPGIFVWWAEVELVDGQKIVLKGDVTVVR